MVLILKRFYASGDALKAIRSVFEQTQLIRIATAYFEASGYHLLQDVLANKEIRLLVGREQGAKDRLENVIREFVDSLSMGSQISRTRAMRQMLDALENGQLSIQVGDDPSDKTSIVDGRYLYQHAKMYIGDEFAAVITSANMSAHGLKTSREAGETVLDSQGVYFFIEKFENYFHKADSVTNRFIDELKAYLNAYEPYFIYARALLELYRLPEEEVPPQLPILAEYQKPAVTRIKTNIEEHGGAFLIASTGLGKTVMAAHVVAYLRMLNLVDSVIIICPAGLKENWRRIMRASKTSSVEFSYYTLSGDDIHRDRQLTILLHELKQADERTLVIVDESHHVRNDRDGRERNERIKELVREREAKILLLTATPFSKNIKDVNDQLALLPSPTDMQKTDLGLYTEANDWNVQKSLELSELPPCFVLTTPTVVKHFGHMDAGTKSRYIAFADSKRYFPTHLRLRAVYYDNPMDTFLVELIESQLLHSSIQDKASEGQETLFDLDEFDSGGKRNALFESQAIHQFCSSPAKVNDFCSKAINGSFNINFAQQTELKDFISRREAELNKWMLHKNDTKLLQLVHIIHEHENEKVVIFCIYIETAKYLYEQLQTLLPQVNIETTAGKKADQLEKILQKFAPLANEVPEDLREEDSLQILIATGTISEGFNLQDASILVNYDLPWTVLQLAQRMGRILRPWHEPRTITIYNLIPSTMQDIRIAKNWQRRLGSQSDEYQAFAEIPIILKEIEGDKGWEMTALARGLQQFAEVNLDLEQIMEFIDNAENLQTTTFYNDLAVIPIEQAREIRSLPTGIRSARLITRGRSKLFLLFSYNKKLYPTLFDDNAKLLVGSENPDEIMRQIRSVRSDAKAPYNLYPSDDEFDEWIEESKQLWAKQRNIEDIHRIQWVCAMALIKPTS